MSLFCDCIIDVKEIDYKIKEYFKDEIIYTTNSLVTSVAIIKRGQVIIKDKNKIIKKLEKNAVIGLSLIFSSNPFYDMIKFHPLLPL